MIKLTESLVQPLLGRLLLMEPPSLLELTESRLESAQLQILHLNVSFKLSDLGFLHFNEFHLIFAILHCCFLIELMLLA